jgi:hypothetical protein
MIKRACDPCEALADSFVQKWLSDSLHKHNSWVLAGHTRFATHGGVNKRNAHPFRKGRIVGTHNGIVDSPIGYIVDSEYLIDTINKDGYKALEGIEGYWGLAWFDGNDNSFWLTVHDGQLAYAVYNGVVYYSSDKSHLASIVDADVFTFVEGQVVKFGCDGIVQDSEQGQIAALDVWAGYGYNWSSRSCAKKTDRAVQDDYEAWVARRESGAILEDGDENFRDAWSHYIHEMDDEDFAKFSTETWN